MLGVIIGISSVILISSIGQGAVQFITDELSAFGTNIFEISPGTGPFSTFAGSSTPLQRADAEAIRRAGIPNVESVAPFGMYSGRITTLDESVSALVYGLTQEAEIILKPEMVYGDFISDEHDSNISRVIVLGIDVSEELFGVGTDPVGESVRIDNNRFRVIGVSRASGALAAGFLNNAVNVPLSTMNTYLTGVDELVEIDVTVFDESLIEQTMEETEEFLRSYRGIADGEDSDFFIVSFGEVLSIVQTVTGLLTLMIVAISGISLVVGGVGVMNIMLVTVTERTREIGLLKAIGARESHILTQFLIESVTLTVVGGVIGVVLGIGGAFVVSLVAGIPFVVSPTSVILAVGVSALVGIVFGLYPARRAAKLNPIDALRYE